MLKIENIEVTGWEAAIRGMRNPMNSWEKSDSGYGCGDQFDTPDIQFCSRCASALFCNALNVYYVVGKNDLDLMKRLAKGGPVHAKFRRMINVTMDITAPLYWWKEFDTYKVGTVANSCSTMHKIQAKEFTLDDFSCEHLLTTVPLAPISINLTGPDHFISSRHFMELACQMLNHYRKLYLETKDKTYWWQMIQLLPSSYNQRRTVQLNYEVLSHIYFDRKDHKLDEWKELCAEIRTLPYSQELITGEQDSDEEDANSVDIKTSNIKFMEDGSVVIAGTKYVLEEADILKAENEKLKERIEFLERFVNAHTPGFNGF